MKPGNSGSRQTPEPEGPDRIAEKFQRTREGASGRLKRAFWRMVGLENSSSGRRTVIVLVGLVELVLLGVSFFTELPSSWVIAAALAILPLVFHKEKGEEEDAPDSS